MNLALEVWHDERVTRGPGPTCEDDEGGRDMRLAAGDNRCQRQRDHPSASGNGLENIKIFTPCLSPSYTNIRERDFILCFVIISKSHHFEFAHGIFAFWHSLFCYRF